MDTTTQPQGREIIIIGGGAAGALVAAQLLRQATGPVSIKLVERRGPVGLGVAYRTELPEHLLNVPAGKMSAWPDRPDDFLEWARQRAGAPGWTTAPGPSDFLPRAAYGQYLADTLADAVAKAPAGVLYAEIEGEAVDLVERPDGGAHVVLADGQTLSADRVVLALGVLSSAYPLKKYLPFYKGDRYVHKPWTPGALDGIPPESDVLLVGQGLTAVDLAMALVSRGHKGVIHLLSRRGLRPQPHVTGGTPWKRFIDEASPPRTVRELSARVRAEVRAAAAQGASWHAVIDALRPITPMLWQALPVAERSRFLRHLQPFWEVHRHRLPPQVHRRFEALLARGRVVTRAGRIIGLGENPGHAVAAVQPRNGGDDYLLHVSKVINCMGPRADYSKYQHPLLVNLLATGLIDHDPLALGLATNPGGEVHRYGGPPSGWLFAIGALLKGTLWESTAIPEIRVQARDLAARLLV